MSRSQRLARILDVAPIRGLLARVPTWNGVLILNYHRVGNPDGLPWDRALWSATEEQLDDQLAVLSREADVIAPQDLATVTGKGRHVMLTFDDGYRDNYELAFPLLRSHGLTATFFLATGFLDEPRVAWWDEIAWMTWRATSDGVPTGEWLDKPVRWGDVTAAAQLVSVYKRLPEERTEPYLEFLADATGSGRCGPHESAGMWMTWDMAREMRDGGMTVGGHTVTHPLLGYILPERQQQEIEICARRLQEELGDSMRWFAYPVGSPDAFTATTKEILRRQGVEHAFSFYGGYVAGSPKDQLDVPRFHVGPGMDSARLRATLRLPQIFAPADSIL